jgi:hypothetical protein
VLLDQRDTRRVFSPDPSQDFAERRKDREPGRLSTPTSRPSTAKKAGLRPGSLTYTYERKQTVRLGDSVGGMPMTETQDAVSGRRLGRDWGEAQSEGPSADRVESGD